MHDAVDALTPVGELMPPVHTRSGGGSGSDAEAQPPPSTDHSEDDDDEEEEEEIEIEVEVEVDEDEDEDHDVNFPDHDVGDLLGDSDGVRDEPIADAADAAPDADADADADVTSHTPQQAHTPRAITPPTALSHPPHPHPPPPHPASPSPLLSSSPPPLSSELASLSTASRLPLRPAPLLSLQPLHSHRSIDGQRGITPDEPEDEHDHYSEAQVMLESASVVASHHPAHSLTHSTTTSDRAVPPVEPEEPSQPANLSLRTTPSGSSSPRLATAARSPTPPSVVSRARDRARAARRDLSSSPPPPTTVSSARPHTPRGFASSQLVSSSAPRRTPRSGRSSGVAFSPPPQSPSGSSGTPAVTHTAMTPTGQSSRSAAVSPARSHPRSTSTLMAPTAATKAKSTPPGASHRRAATGIINSAAVRRAATAASHRTRSFLPSPGSASPHSGHSLSARDLDDLWLEVAKLRRRDQEQTNIITSMKEKFTLIEAELVVKERALDAKIVEAEAAQSAMYALSQRLAFMQVDANFADVAQGAHWEKEHAQYARRGSLVNGDSSDAGLPPMPPMPALTEVPSVDSDTPLPHSLVLAYHQSISHLQDLAHANSAALASSRESASAALREAAEARSERELIIGLARDARPGSDAAQYDDANGFDDDDGDDGSLASSSVPLLAEKRAMLSAAQSTLARDRALLLVAESTAKRTATRLEYLRERLNVQSTRTGEAAAPTTTLEDDLRACLAEHDTTTNQCKAVADKVAADERAVAAAEQEVNVLLGEYHVAHTLHSPRRLQRTIDRLAAAESRAHQVADSADRTSSAHEARDDALQLRLLRVEHALHSHDLSLMRAAAQEADQRAKEKERECESLRRQLNEQRRRRTDERSADSGDTSRPLQRSHASPRASAMTESSVGGDPTTEMASMNHTDLPPATSSPAAVPNHALVPSVHSSPSPSIPADNHSADADADSPEEMSLRRELLARTAALARLELRAAQLTSMRAQARPDHSTNEERARYDAGQLHGRAAAPIAHQSEPSAEVAHQQASQMPFDGREPDVHTHFPLESPIPTRAMSSALPSESFPLSLSAATVAAPHHSGVRPAEQSPAAAGSSRSIDSFSAMSTFPDARAEDWNRERREETINQFDVSAAEEENWHRPPEDTSRHHQQQQQHQYPQQQHHHHLVPSTSSSPHPSPLLSFRPSSGSLSSSALLATAPASAGASHSPTDPSDLGGATSGDADHSRAHSHLSTTGPPPRSQASYRPPVVASPVPLVVTRNQDETPTRVAPPPLTVVTPTDSPRVTGVTPLMYPPRPLHLLASPARPPAHPHLVPAARFSSLLAHSAYSVSSIPPVGGSSTAGSVAPASREEKMADLMVAQGRNLLTEEEATTTTTLDAHAIAQTRRQQQRDHLNKLAAKIALMQHQKTAIEHEVGIVPDEERTTKAAAAEAEIPKEVPQRDDPSGASSMTTPLASAPSVTPRQSPRVRRSTSVPRARVSSSTPAAARHESPTATRQRKPPVPVQSSRRNKTSQASAADDARDTPGEKRHTQPRAEVHTHTATTPTHSAHVHRTVAPPAHDDDHTSSGASPALSSSAATASRAPAPGPISSRVRWHAANPKESRPADSLLHADPAVSARTVAPHQTSALLSHSPSMVAPQRVGDQQHVDLFRPRDAPSHLADPTVAARLAHDRDRQRENQRNLQLFTESAFAPIGSDIQQQEEFETSRPRTLEHGWPQHHPHAMGRDERDAPSPSLTATTATPRARQFPSDSPVTPRATTRIYALSPPPPMPASHAHTIGWSPSPTSTMGGAATAAGSPSRSSAMARSRSPPTRSSHAPTMNLAHLYAPKSPPNLSPSRDHVRTHANSNSAVGGMMASSPASGVGRGGELAEIASRAAALQQMKREQTSMIRTPRFHAAQK